MNSIDPAVALITFFGFLVALTMHEAAHAFASKALGDNSVETSERATINPIPHIDIFGTLLFPLMMLFSGVTFLFGWAKPYQYDSRHYKKIKRDINFVSLAGPFTNFLLAIICILAMRFTSGGISDIFNSENLSTKMLNSVAMANIVIGLLNLIPFPGSDGWRILLNSVNYSTASKLQQLSWPISIAMLLLLIFGMFHPVVMFTMKIFYQLLLV